VIEKMGETVEFIVEQTEGFRRMPEVFRGAERLAGDMERLETLCHWSASAGRQVSLTSYQFTYRSNSDRNFCRQEHLQFHCLPICTSDSPSY
jgi:N6-adenosine-specific RNA methylase IME4